MIHYLRFFRSLKFLRVVFMFSLLQLVSCASCEGEGDEKELKEGLYPISPSYQ